MSCYYFPSTKIFQLLHRSYKKSLWIPVDVSSQLARLLKIWAKIFISVNQHSKMKLITANMNHFVRIQVEVGLKRWTNNAHALLLICSFCHQSSGQKLSSIWTANNIAYSAKIIWRVFALLLLLLSTFRFGYTPSHHTPPPFPYS